MGVVKKSKKTNSSSAGGVGSARGNSYQKQVAAWWLTRVLTQNTVIGSAFGLSAGVLPIRVVGQTEDPVDDVRIEFSDKSRFFIQCKRSVRLSEDLASEFGKAWIQFCHQIKREKGSAYAVRCVLCYEETNTSLVKLVEVFRRARQDSAWTKISGFVRAQQEKTAIDILSRLHGKLLKKDRSLPSFHDLVSAVYFQRLETHDACDAHVQSTEALQNGILSELGQTSLAVGILEALGEELTTSRGFSYDIAAIRLRLSKAGVRLRDIPEFASDLQELDAESDRTLEAFHAYHRDQLHGRYTLDRLIVSEVTSRVADDSLLIIGEPGAGKTGVLMAVAQKLKLTGLRVWFLSVEGYKAESLPSLEKELNISHRLTDIFGFAAEKTRAVLLLDGLDAARDRVKQTTWRDLVREAKRRGVLVIATIRIFDLRHSQPWQELFPLATTETESNAMLGLSKVRFTNVGELSDIELNQALLAFPIVSELAENQPSIRKLAANIYNLNLLCELAESVMPHNPLHTQLELLNVWWEKRVVEASEEQVETMLVTLIERMVSSRSLQASVIGLGNELVRVAQSTGILRAVHSRPGFIPNDFVEFTHNVLFDYAAFRCFVRPKRDQLASELATHESWGLFLRPSLGHFFTWLWDNYREDFWQRSLKFQKASVPILHKTSMWFTIARSVQKREDFAPILNGIVNSGVEREAWLSLACGVNGCAEAALWKQLYRRNNGLWWVEYACDLLRSGDMYVSNLGWQILYALYYEIQHFKQESFPLINLAARLEVEAHWAIAVALGPGTKPCIWLFCRTIAGNPEESAKLIRKMLAPEELARSGYYRGHEVANEIFSIARSLPDLAVEIYERLYSYREMSMEQEPMGSSAVLPMQMSRHDMYAAAYHNLETGLHSIFDFSPGVATRAVCRVLSGKGYDVYPQSESSVSFWFHDSEIKTADLSLVYNDIDGAFDDKSRLLAAWRERMRNVPNSKNAGEQWKEVAKSLIQDTAPPDMWAALLTVIPDHPGFFQDAIWPMLNSPDLLSCWHFKKCIDPCVHALAKTANRVKLNHWQEVVLALGLANLRRHNYPDNSDALEKLKSSYLLCLSELTLTQASRQFLAQCKKENVREYHPSQPRDFTPDVRLIIERHENGLNPSNPLHLQLEKDLAGLASLKKVGPSILKQITEIDARFLNADEQLKSRMRGQFQNGFSWALRELADKKGAKLTDQQLLEMLQMCEELLATRSGINNALDAIGLVLSKKRNLKMEQRELLERIVARPEPEIIGRFGYYVWAFLKPWPEFVWSCLDRWTKRMGESEVAKALRHALHDSWFWWLYHVDKKRALELLERMLVGARQTQNTELADSFLAWFAAVAIRENDLHSRAFVETALIKPEVFGSEMPGAVQVLVAWHMPRDPKSMPPADKLQIAYALTQLFFNSARTALVQWQQQQNLLPSDQKTKEATPWVKSVVQQFDRFATELRWSAEDHAKTFASKSPVDFKALAELWWERAEPILIQLEKWLHPHSGHNVIGALGIWYPHYPTRCLQWLRRLCEAGTRTGMLSDRMIASDVIKILQRCLAEHRDLLASDKMFLQNFASVLEALLTTVDAEALGMAASLDEFYR